MRSEFLAAAAYLIFAAPPALADDRPVTDDERAKLVAAVTAGFRATKLSDLGNSERYSCPASLLHPDLLGPRGNRV